MWREEKIGAARLILGDCREILATLGKVDAVVTDPPYGINAARDRKSEKHGWTDYPEAGWDKERAAPDLIIVFF
jgi:DNA modification methylase